MALNDLRYAARWLRASPGFTLLVVLTLALGIGGTTAIFSAVNPVLFQPLPYPDAGRIVAILEMRRDGSRNDGTFGMYRQLVERNRSLESIAVFVPWQPTMTGATQPERFDGQRVSASYFRVLGVSPALGRDFAADDDRMNGPAVVILSDGVWRRRFNADSGIVGRQVTLDETRATIIGVMPSRFENVLGPSTGIWAPLQYDVSQERAWGHHLRTVARLRPGVAVARASQELNAIGHAVLQDLRPVTYGRELELVAVRLQEEVTRSVRPALLAILGAVALVLVIACVNVTNLLLARGVQRRGEFALRSALGAGPGHLVIVRAARGYRHWIDRRRRARGRPPLDRRTATRVSRRRQLRHRRAEIEAARLKRFRHRRSAGLSGPRSAALKGPPYIDVETALKPRAT